MGPNPKQAGSSGLPKVFHTRDDRSPWRQRFEHIHHILRKRITSLEYEPGMRLDVDELSEEFGVSRTPVRNVLKHMDHEGLVKTRHGVGTIVAPLELEYMRQAVQFRIEIVPLIGTLEPKPINARTIEAMQDTLESYRSLLGQSDPGLFAEADLQCHASVCMMIGNSLLLKTYDELYFRTARLWFYRLPDQNWDEEVAIFIKDIELMQLQMERNDPRGVSFVLRNAIGNAFARSSLSLAPEGR
ncbi:GntR family transcriptional regulator [Hoeflea prorocentri]|uniref:GntR family transcriptional regulator n=1 Tax=Hoeflea prorocentri TaxID=1922333 RepID=A0A9X3UI03_9HYPH|nr:GntR family transcriptional regulator [Hoeflea prorocentri]MCY6380795.1 GntR family transcriptional regulator [Hoeflea prorocentri]MDA5398595.1 GntR family transcriptional regulator [Hoeflea prorocentri]